ncbi:MAG: hypothetical protein KBA51_07230 [Kiritimatiellae bacterium]|nr:hypothetical protein [Kiritimatiellia bacterium]
MKTRPTLRTRRWLRLGLIAGVPLICAMASKPLSRTATPSDEPMTTEPAIQTPPAAPPPDVSPPAPPAGPAQLESTEPSVRFYPVGVGDPAALVRMAHAMIGEDRPIVWDQAGRRIMALATADEHVRLSKLFQAAAAPPRNIRVDVWFDEHEEGSRTEAGVRGEGGVVLGSGGAHGQLILRPNLQAQTDTRQRQTAQMLVTASGRAASLRVGEQVPYANWLIERAFHWQLTSVSTGWQEVGAFLWIEPELIGEGAQATIRIRITPEISGRAGGAPQRVRFTQLTTEVFARPGETVTLGSLGDDDEFAQKFLFGFSRERRSSGVIIRMTPTLLE